MLAGQFRKMVINTDVKVGMTELSKVTKVSPSQIRYWERKGYIKSEQEEQNQNHYYSLRTVYRVFAIKYYLDQGYTLQGAVKKMRDRQENSRIFIKFLNDRLKDVVQTGPDKGEVVLGPLDDDPSQEVYARVDRHGKTTLHLRPINRES